jgi:hypothetical protein
MACGYISSNDERLYAGVELTYGQVPPIVSANRLPAVRLGAKQTIERPHRRDKTGTRTFPGTPAGLRKKTTFELTTYLTSWTQQDREPGYGPLFQASLGAPPAFFAGSPAGLNESAKLLTLAEDHALQAGHAVTFGGEMRFVTSVIDARTVELNAPFSMQPTEGSPIGATVTYVPATSIETVSLFDYWSPAGAVSRIIAGAAVEQMRLKVNGDYHEFEFRGYGRDLIDSASFAAGDGDLMEFPEEPAPNGFEYTIIPGHLGQAWMGNTPDRFYTITAAEVTVGNDLELRTREFGSDMPRCLTPGVRTVSVAFDLFELNNPETKALYQAARQQSTIPMMLQLGQQPGQMFGLYLKSVMPEIPEFDDDETRLQWKFTNCRAQGTGDDEITVAFG